MIDKIKSFLGLNPMGENDTKLDIKVGVVDGKLHLQLSKKVDVVTFDKIQLSQLLVAVASHAKNVK